MEWATQLSKRKSSKIQKPAVIGVIIDLGYCLDLLDYKNLDFLKAGYLTLLRTVPDKEFPKNRGTDDLLLRELDCAVIETLHKSIFKNSEKEFDSGRGVFWEGKELYPNAGFREKDHIQICIRNTDCIKGYFLPLKRIVS